MNAGYSDLQNGAGGHAQNDLVARQAAQTIYLLGKSDGEPERLVKQAELHRPETRQMLDAIGLHEGAEALDAGCGPLGILDELAMRVGNMGMVVGLERSQRFRDYAAAMLRRQGFSNVKMVGGHARRMDLPSERFDLSHARLLLVNMPRPQEVVAEMVRVTRPGGVVALQEVDWVSWTCEPMMDSWIRLKRAARSVWQQDGLDVHIGRRLPCLLRRAGLCDIEIKTRTHAWYPGDLKHSFLLALLKRVRRDVVERGLLSAAQLERFEKELEEHLASPETMVLSPTYFQVWGRRPASI